jgi:prepilin-type N-terminal cleavage/methylation domain-containing protein
MKKSFTLVELLVVISVFVILSVLSFVNFRGGGMGSSLKRDSVKIALNLRKIEEMSIAGKEFGPSSICNNCY